MNKAPLNLDRPRASPLGRIDSIDLLRGIVILLMALDHVRHFWSMTPFSPTDLEHSTPVYFFTRWVTHFCAPVFVFLCGTSAWLYRRNSGCSFRHLSRFLVTRGMWLIVVEITLVSFAWQFGYRLIVLQVIWAIGCSMIALGFLVFLPRPLIFLFGIAVVALHNTLDGIGSGNFSDFAWLWAILHSAERIPLPDAFPVRGLQVVYPLVPWIGVMALGFVFGALFDPSSSARRSRMVLIGVASILAFLVLRLSNMYGDPGLGTADAPWHNHDRGALYGLMSILNTTKYPPSFLYLLMTLGPPILVLPLLENARGRMIHWIRVFGRVPFFFYILHLYVIHATADIWFGLAYGAWGIEPFDAATWPEGYSPNLLRAYGVWVALAWILYWPCRWFGEIRRKYRYRWLRYL